jgi:hypothetical protein
VGWLVLSGVGGCQQWCDEHLRVAGALCFDGCAGRDAAVCALAWGYGPKSGVQSCEMRKKSRKKSRACGGLRSACGTQTVAQDLVEILRLHVNWIPLTRA